MLLMIHDVGYMYSKGVMQYLQMLLMIHGVGYYVMYSNGVMQYIQMLLMIHDVGYYVMYSKGVHTNASNAVLATMLCIVME